MEYVSRDSTKRELLSWLRAATKNEVVAVCLLVNKIADADVPVYGAKEELIAGLWDAEREDLWSAVDSIFPEVESDDCEEEEVENEDDEAEEDEFEAGDEPEEDSEPSDEEE